MSFSVFLLFFSLFLLPTVGQAADYIKGRVLYKDAGFKKTAYVSLYCRGSGWNSCSDWDETDKQGNFNLEAGSSYYKCCSSTNSGTTWSSCQLYAYQWQDTTIANSDSIELGSLDCAQEKSQDLSLRAKDKTFEVTLKAGPETITAGMYVYAYQNSPPYSYGYVNSASNGRYNVLTTSGTFTIASYCDWSYWYNRGEACPFSGNPTKIETLTANDISKSVTLNFDKKDKIGRFSVRAGSKAVTSGIGVCCSQQSPPWSYGCDSTANSDGKYEVSMVAGSHYCYSYPTTWPSIYSGTPNIYMTIGSNDSIVDAELKYQVKDKKILARVQTATGKIFTSGMACSFYQQGGNWDYTTVYSANSEGYYEGAVGIGTYTIYCWNQDWRNSTVSGYPSGKCTFTDEDPEGTECRVKLTYLENNATVSGVVTPAVDTWLSFNANQVTAQSGAAASSSVVKALTVTHGTADATQVFQSAQTSNGSFTVTLPAGTYTVRAWPSRSDYAPTSQTVTAKAGTTTAITLNLTQKTAQISGCVTDSNGNAVRSYVNCWSYNGATGDHDYNWKQTDSNGCYSLYAVAGYTYDCNASPDTWSNTSSQYCSYTNEGTQSITATSAPQTLNYTVGLCDCTLSVNAVDAQNNIVPVSGSIDCTRTNASTSGYYTGNWGYLSSGTGKLDVEENEPLQCKLWFWDTSYMAGDRTSCSCADGASSCNVSVAPIIKGCVAGSFLDGDGSSADLNNISYISVYCQQGGNYRSCTTTKTGYSCDLREGAATCGYWIDPASGYASASAGTTSNEITCSSSGQTTHDITLMDTCQIDATVLNMDETPRSKVWLEACPFSASQEGANSYQYHYNCNWGESDENGNATIRVGCSPTEEITYYVNAYIPYGARAETNNPEECSVIASPSQSNSCVLRYEKPDGLVTVTVAEGEIAVSALSVGKAKSASENAPLLRQVVNADETDASSPIAHATVDLFSPAGGSFEVISDESGSASSACTTDDTWYAVCHNMVGNALYVSKATELSCTIEGGTGTCEIDYVTTVPDPLSRTIANAGTETMELALNDNFRLQCPPGSLGDVDETVTCSVSPVVTPFMANRMPACFYGYYVQCLDENGVAIQQLNSPCTLTLPLCNMENLGLTEDDTESSYFNDQTGAYSQVPSVMGSNTATLSVSHFTDFVIVGNGYLGGIQGEEGGEVGKEAASAASGGCGCYVMESGDQPLDDRLIWLVLLSLFGMSRFKLSQRSQRLPSRDRCRE